MRRLKLLISTTILFLLWGTAGAQPAKPKDVDRFMHDLKAFLLKKVNAPEIAGYGFYDSFKFNSATGGLSNRYTGDATFLSVAGDNFVFHDVHTGFFVSNLETNLNATSTLSSSQEIKNNTHIGNAVLNLHADKLLFNILYVGVFGGYGLSNFGLQSIISNTGTPATSSYGSAHFGGSNNYIGGRVSYFYPFKKFRLQGNLNYAYSSFFQPNYTVVYNNASNEDVPALTTHFGILTENVRLSYQKSANFQPFITAGLLQVVNRYYSNTVVVASTSSASPQLTLSNNGFYVGTGLSYTLKHFRFVPYYQYGQRGTTYRDNLVALRIAFLCS